MINSIEIGVLISVMGLIIAFLTFKLNKQKTIVDNEKYIKNSIEKEATENAELKAELRYIRSGVDDIKLDIKANERQMSQFGERITRNEEVVKSIQKRVEKLEGKEL